MFYKKKSSAQSYQFSSSILSQKKTKRGLEKRANPAAAQMAAKAGEKGVEMVGKMAEKNMETMRKQQGKVDKFVGEEVIELEGGMVCQ